MYATERQQQIERLLAADGRVGVVELAARFAVTTETVRRDLAGLEQAGLLRRVHGGAVAAGAGATTESSLLERAGRNSAAKQSIARLLLDTLPRSGSLYLDAGTTTAALAALLADGSRTGLDVVTHSMTVAHTLAGVDALTLSSIGGRVRGLTAAAVGAQTVEAIGRLRPDVAVVGANGLSAAFGVSTPDPDEAQVKRAIVAAARRVIVAADADKFDRELLVHVAAWTDIDVLATDRPPRGALAEALAAADVEVWT